MRVFGKKLTSFTLVALFLGTTLVAATEETTVVQGHVNWSYISGYDKCIAAVAGLASSRVLWFDDSILVDNFNFGDTWVYAIQAGAPDPRGRTLAYVRSFEFDDPNGLVWNVSEYQYFAAPASSEPAHAHVDEIGAGTTGANAHEHADARAYYTWVVRLIESPESDRHAGNDPHDRYNFVLLVDTCKFIGDATGAAEHAAGSHPDDPYYNGAQHGHETFEADLLLGGAPDGRGIRIDVDSEAEYRQKGGATNEGSHSTPYTP